MADNNYGLVLHRSPEISSRELIKIKIKDSTEVEMAYVETYKILDQEEFSNSAVQRTCDYLPHADLLFAMNMFVPHMLMINEMFYISDSDKEQIMSQHKDGIVPFLETKTTEFLQKHFVSGITISGDNEHRGVTIIGGKRLKGNKVLNLITPFMKFESDDYAYGAELGACLSYLEKECWEYLNGKSSQAKQLNMFDQAVSDVNIQMKNAGIDIDGIHKMLDTKAAGKKAVENNGGAVI